VKRLPLLIVAMLIAAFPASALAGGGPAPRECPQETVHDYLAPTRGFPRLKPFPIGELPRRFGPLGLDMSPPLELPNTAQVLGPTFRFFGAAGRVALDLDLTFTLTRLNHRGRALGKPAVKRTRLRSITASTERTVGVRISGRPALYRIEMEARNGSGRNHASYGQYVRVVRRNSDPRLLLGKPSLRPGEVTSIGVAEFGTGFLVFKPSYSVEAFDGTNWVPTTIQARTPAAIFAPLADSGAVATCSKLPIPAGTPPGRYRISQRVEHRWGFPRPQPVHTVLSAEFTVLP
jgi:hypothetical protein